ncbi:unnamed protein product [Debaryomyces tyrocola]|nr:unnamed protein product [Debaryomyces tyrocola]
MLFHCSVCCLRFVQPNFQWPSVV